MSDAEIRLPELAAAGAGAVLVRWLVGPGDAVAPGDVVAEVESDKTVVEIEAHAAGVIEALHVAEGTGELAGGTLLASLARPGESPPRSTAGEEEAPAPAQAPSAGPGTSRPVPRVADAEGAATASDAAGPGASPLAERLARQAGIDLGGLAGSGAGGRVLAADVLAAAGGETAAPAALTAHGPGGEVRVLDAGPTPPYELLAPDPARRVVAARMTAAKREQPHYYMTRRCTVDALLELRALLDGEAPEGGRITLNDLLIKVVACALVREPALNAAWSEAGVRRYRSADIAVAVAGEHGLITPVVRGAERLRIGAIAAEMRRLTERARRGELTPEEHRGATFTLSNLGMHGVEAFAAILNPPQAAILAVGAATPEPVAAAGEVRIATRMSLTLSVDHRVADGVEGARFLAEVAALIEDPRRLLL